MRGVVASRTSAETRTHLERMLDVGVGALGVYESAYGPLPVDEVHVLPVPPRFPFAGLGLLGNVMLADTVLTDAYSYLVEQGIAHELAHSWWGNLLPPLEENEALATAEGLAEYSAWMSLGRLEGDDVRTSGARMNSVWYMYARPGDQDLAPFQPGLRESPVAVYVGYHKACQAWRTVAEAAGEEGFDRAIGQLAARGGAATSADIVAEVESVTGYDATRDVSEWFRATGFPHIVAASTLADGQACLDLTVDGDYHLHLPVGVRSSDGAIREEVVEVGSGDNHVCVSAPTPPAAIEIDPRWTMSREVRPALAGDVTLDGVVDAADLMAIALGVGTALPEERRIDGRYDPLYDTDQDRDVDADDLLLPSS